MPIRFRCVYCKQLMGISRRKAGTVVRCPKCSHQVMVPVTDEGPNPPVPAESAPIFERSDFDDLIQQAAPEPAKMFAFDPGEAVPAPPVHASAVPETEMQPAEDKVEKATPINAASGLLLSPTMATTLAVCVIIGLAIAFVVGLFIGYRLRPHETASVGSAMQRSVIGLTHQVGTQVAKDLVAAGAKGGIGIGPSRGRTHGDSNAELIGAP